MLYPLCQAVMTSHLEVRRGYRSSCATAAPSVQGYQQWLADQVNPGGALHNIDAVRGWFNGEARPHANKLTDLFRALGLNSTSSDPEQRHLMWELQVCVFRSPRIEKTWYSATIDEQRLKLRQQFANTVSMHIAEPMRIATVSVMADDTAGSQVFQVPEPADASPTGAAMSIQFRRSIDMLAAADATDLRQALRWQLDSNAASDPPKAPVPCALLEVQTLVECLRAKCQIDPKAAMKATINAIKHLKKHGPSLGDDALEHTCRAASQLFVMFLGEFAAQSAQTAPNQRVHNKGLTFSTTDNPLAAAVLAELHHLNGELRLVYPSQRANGRLFDVKHYMSADDPGIRPGSDVQAHKADLETRIRKELSGTPSLPKDVPLIRPSWNDSELSGFVEQLADFDDVHFRFLVDVTPPEGPARLDVARLLHRDIGLPAVAYGPDAAMAEGFNDCGSLRPGTGNLDSLLVMLLKELHVLNPRVQPQ